MKIVMRRKILTALIFLVIAALAYIFIEAPFSKKHFVKIKGSLVEVELANTEYLRKKGLMGRQSLKESEGMLFIFPEETRPPFWMKNTLIPLSVAFIKGDGTISAIHDMAPDTFSGSLKSFRSEERVEYALEVIQGWFDRHGVMVGDKTEFSKSIERSPVE